MYIVQEMCGCVMLKNPDRNCDGAGAGSITTRSVFAESAIIFLHCPAIHFAGS